ncbi:hypothetical protein Dsin_021345 [Dipteronia sinensis]|uniref:Uncharacterized protein n=1 Tax=Dipteronia sinensis TaxID=43782 RepID=A0AAE0A006_9ROSI|nr:hypothetical protein Dsin_021345 [Dipteronia sinensis]
MGGIAWSEEEDHLLKKCIQQYGEGKWNRIPLLSDSRYVSEDFETKINITCVCSLKLYHMTWDQYINGVTIVSWSLIAARLTGRTGNDIKNYWNCHLSRKLINAEHQNREKQITTKVEVSRPVPRYCNAATPVPPTPCLEEMPHLQPSQEESSSSSTPLILQHPELEQSRNVEINEDVNFAKHKGFNGNGRFQTGCS